MTTAVFAQLLSPSNNSTTQKPSELGSNLTKVKLASQPDDIAVNPLTNTVYVVSESDNSTYVIDGKTNRVVKTIHIDNFPSAIAVNPSTNMVYVFCNDDTAACDSLNPISVIDGKTNSVVKTIDLSDFPVAIAVNPNTNKVYVLGDNNSTMFVIDGHTNKVLDTVPHGAGYGSGIAVNPNTNMIYVVNDKNLTFAIDGNTNNVVKTIKGNVKPTYVAVNPNTNMIYTINNFYNTTSVIDGNTNNIVKTVRVGAYPNGIAINPNTNQIYAPVSGSIAIIDGNTNTLVKTIGMDGFGIAINTNTNTVYIGTNKSISVISQVNQSSSSSSPFPPTSAPTALPNETVPSSMNNTTNRNLAAVNNIQQDYLTWYSKGTALLNSGNYTGSIAAYDKAIFVDPNHAAAWNNRAEALSKLGRYDEAVASYDKASSLNPNIALIWNNKGAVLYRLGKYNESIAAYDKAISLEPNNTMFQQNRDIVLKHTGLTSVTPNTNSNSNMTGLSQPQPGNVTNPSRASLPSSAPMFTYENRNITEFRIRMQYPSNWITNATVDRIVNGTKVVEFDTPSTGFSNNLIVFVRHVNNEDSIFHELQRSIESNSFNPGYKILEANTNATLSKQPAYLLVDSTTNTNGLTTNIREIGTIIGDKVYIVQYFADSADYFTYLPTINKMIDSIVITSNK